MTRPNCASCGTPTYREIRRVVFGAVPSFSAASACAPTLTAPLERIPWCGRPSCEQAIVQRIRDNEPKPKPPLTEHDAAVLAGYESVEEHRIARQLKWVQLRAEVERAISAAAEPN